MDTNTHNSKQGTNSSPHITIAGENINNGHTIIHNDGSVAIKSRQIEISPES